MFINLLTLFYIAIYSLLKYYCMKKFSISHSCLLLMLFCSLSLFSQISTDRPGISNSATTVPQHALQIESGYAFSTNNDFNGNTTYHTSSISLRYGIFDFWEVRGFLGLGTIKFLPFGDIENKVLFGQPALASKLRLAKTSDFTFSILPALYFPTARFDNLSGELQAIASVNLKGGGSHTINISKRFDEFFNVIHASYFIDKTIGKLSPFIEIFSTYDLDSNADNFSSLGIDGGFAYRFNNNSQLGFAIGTDWKSFTSFFSIGFSYLIQESSETSQSLEK